MKTSPVEIFWDKSKHRLVVKMAETGRTLARCEIGDDETMERIADILSEKRLPEDAQRVRKIIMESRTRKGCKPR